MRDQPLRSRYVRVAMNVSFTLEDLDERRRGRPEWYAICCYQTAREA